MQIWSEPSAHDPQAAVRAAVETCRQLAWRALDAIGRSAGIQVTRLNRVVIATGDHDPLVRTLITYAVREPHVVLVFPSASDLVRALRPVSGPDRVTLRGRMCTAEQIANGQHRTQPYAGLVVTDWDACDERQRVALQADLRPLVAIGLRR